MTSEVVVEAVISLSALALLVLSLVLATSASRAGANASLRRFGASGLLFITCLPALVVSNMTEGAVSQMGMALFWGSLLASTVVLVVALARA